MSYHVNARVRYRWEREVRRATPARPSFYPRDAMLARVLALLSPVSVCLSVCHKSAFYRKIWTDE